MKFTVNWLKKYVDFDLSAGALADRLTMLGLEVDAVQSLYPGLEHIKVARIVSVEKHPNADKLSLCDVMVGEEQKRIVCGAPNVRAGMLAPIALPGCQMPSGLLIKKSKIRGETSEGMLCSGAELGIVSDSAGLMDLPESCHCGASLTAALDLADTMIEVDITPNRADCTSLLGIAREVGGVTGNPIKPPVETPPILPATSSNFSVEILAPDACPRYAARLLKNVKIGPSPWWLKRLLLAVGLRPINNVVDITNFVMLEYGQPLHAFDFAKIGEGRIVVRKAQPAETISTLDGTERTLTDEMLLICDAKKAIAIAGVMGGENSEVTAQTTEVLLESAYFAPTSIRRTSRALKLSTDASYRFERGIDPQGTLLALERAAKLIVECCGAEFVDDGVDCNHGIAEPALIHLRASQTCKRLGTSLTIEEIASLLARIGITAARLDADTLQVTVPSFRIDLEREIDLIEEVARLKGYNEIHPTLPAVPMSLSCQEPSFILRRKVANIMVALGVFEAINYSFNAARYSSMLGLAADDPLREQITIVNPLADDQGVMRTMLLPGLLENIRHNLNRQTNDISLFEIGKVFWPHTGHELPREAIRLGAVFSGRPGIGSPMLHYGDRAFDIYDLKGVAEVLLSQLGIKGAQFCKADSAPSYADQDEWLTVTLPTGQLGSFGKLAQSTLKEFGIKQAVYSMDFDLDLLTTLAIDKPLFTPLSKFPSVSWDLAVLVPEETGAGTILQAIMAKNFPLVDHVEIFDVYRGQNISAGMKSVALSITYHSDEKTLDDKVVGHVHEQVVELICTLFKGQLREV
ncbi:MAG: phenylalanine--tRNA ligase subunit beta [Desulfobulbaceae bacterium]|nr:phenylalanine--tRNA ligase subunit beta [Desulfobulbaceae bacterium]